MLDNLRNERFTPTAPKRRRSGVLWWLIRWSASLVAVFLIGSVAMVVVYRFVPVPVTWTMLLDPNGFDKDWTPLSEIRVRRTAQTT